ncbi:MAG: HAMP domain-containing protein [Planctomycetes bacterium]|nr:HAMP domain-containing protein [Planctomycetota bacterium]
MRSAARRWGGAALLGGLLAVCWGGVRWAAALSSPDFSDDSLSARAGDALDAARFDLDAAARALGAVAESAVHDLATVSDPEGSGRAAAFEVLRRRLLESDDADLGLLHLTPAGSRVAWAGALPGFPFESFDLSTARTDVSPGTMSTHLYVVRPMPGEGGSVIATRLAVVAPSLPASLRRGLDLNRRWASRHGVEVRWDIAQGDPSETLPQVDALPWTTPEGVRLGALRAGRTPSFAGEPTNPAEIDAFFLVLGWLALTLLVTTVLQARRRSAPLRLAMAAVGVWGTRAVLALLFRPAGPFGSASWLAPDTFAYDAPFGLCASPGDFAATMLALAATLVLAGRGLGIWLRDRSGLWRRAALALFVIGVVRLAAWSAHTVMHDSTIDLFAAWEPWPTLPAALLLGGVLALTLGGLIGLEALVCNADGAWVATVLTAAAAGALASAIPPEPLGVWAWPISAAALALAVALPSSPPRLLFPTTVFRLCASTLLLAPWFAAETRESHRLLLSNRASELRTDPDWITARLRGDLQALVSSADIRLALQGGGRGSGTAYLCWTRTSLGHAAVDSALAILDARGKPLDEFRAGLPAFEHWYAPAPGGGRSGDVRAWSAEVHEDTGGSRTVVIARLPCALSDGRTLSVVLGVATGTRRSSTTSCPDFLRHSTIEEPAEEAATAEYDGSGRLVWSDQADVPSTLDPLPTEPDEWRSLYSQDQVWDMLIVPRPGQTGWWVVRGPAPSLAGDVRLAFQLWLVAVALTLLSIPLRRRTRTAGWPGLHWFRGHTFEVRLAAATVTLVIVPTALLAVLARANAARRAEESQNQRLDTTLRVGANLFASAMPSPAARSTTKAMDVCAEIASILGQECAVYHDGILLAASRPELVDLGVFRASCDPALYVPLALGQAPSARTTLTVGRARIPVAAAPIRMPDGGTPRLFVVPHLYGQTSFERDLARANLFAFGVSTLVVLVAIAFAVLAARRISNPILAIARAADRIANGDFTARVTVPAEGDIADLVEAFNRMARDLERARDAIVRVEREAAWREMAQQVAHEIKNPLTPMKLAAQNLRAAHETGAEGFREMLVRATDTIVRQADLLSRIASDFSEFAKLPQRKPVPLSLTEIASEAVRLFEPSLPATMKLETDLAPAPPPVRMDRDETVRVFTNLLKNAVQAMPSGGVLRVRTWVEPAAVCAGVIDSGPGIPPEVRPHLFEPHFSTKAEGSGLGLAVCRRAIEAAGGTIDIESGEGKGTCVWFRIPRDERGA